MTLVQVNTWAVNAVPPTAPPAGVPPPAAMARYAARAPALSRDILARVIPYGQYQLTRMGPAGQAGLAALFAASIVAVTLVIPARNAVQSLTSDVLHARQTPHRAASPGDGIARILTALPTREQIPAVLRRVVQEAQKVGVQLDNGTYAFRPGKPGSVASYAVLLPVKASYPQIRNFINGTLASVPAAGLDKLRVERKAIGETAVHADVQFMIFVRGE